MTIERVQGLAEAESLFSRVPDAARAEMAEVLEFAGDDLLAGQRADVPKATGFLASTLAVRILIDELKVRVGLFREGRRAGQSDNFYGRIIEFGRKFQTVTVQRRRRVGGVLRTRRGRKRAEDVVAIYSLKVKARAPRPFIFTGRVGRVEQRLANFFSAVMSRAGANG
jgi:hypothetical protein